ncbi:MAG TPA: penicillin-binding protein 2, partial [Hyphomicrobiaceae bacterium]|nr:penicillin-binding protein 2 [Hyphomicrobiaceae bacterium]
KLSLVAWERSVAAAEPAARTFIRTDIVDRAGRLIATDVPISSLWADPAVILDRDEVLDRLSEIFPDLDTAETRRLIADRSKRFVWLRRHLRPIDAQRVHELGLPGLALKREPKRAYPLGRLAGHIVGTVNIDNKGTAGAERAIDEAGLAEPAYGPGRPRAESVRLAIDMGAQHLLSAGLEVERQRYKAKGAGAIVMDIVTGEILAAVSLPGIDPALPVETLDPERLDKLAGGVFELGSINKIFAVAMAFEQGFATPQRIYDVRQPIVIGRHTIRDLHPQYRPLTVREIFITSSNIGAGMLALEAGAEHQRAFLDGLGLISPLRTEIGAIAPPLLPTRWDKIETVTIAYGHGLAVAPVQLLASAATLFNGGYRVTPHFHAAKPGTATERVRILSAETSARMRELMRQNVTIANGTGRRAETAGVDIAALELGGKTGTAEQPGAGGYREKAVISSFLAITPASDPRHIALVMLFEPAGTEETKGQITAGVTAAPATARILARLAPALGLGRW